MYLCGHLKTFIKSTRGTRNVFSKSGHYQGNKVSCGADFSCRSGWSGLNTKGCLRVCAHVRGEARFPGGLVAGKLGGRQDKDVKAAALSGLLEIKPRLAGTVLGLLAIKVVMLEKGEVEKQKCPWTVFSVGNKVTLLCTVLCKAPC